MQNTRKRNAANGGTRNEIFFLSRHCTRLFPLMLRPSKSLLLSYYKKRKISFIRRLKPVFARGGAHEAPHRAIGSCWSRGAPDWLALATWLANRIFQTNALAFIFWLAFHEFRGSFLRGSDQKMDLLRAHAESLTSEVYSSVALWVLV